MLTSLLTRPPVTETLLSTLRHFARPAWNAFSSAIVQIVVCEPRGLMIDRRFDGLFAGGSRFCHICDAYVQHLPLRRA